MILSHPDIYRVALSYLPKSREQEGLCLYRMDIDFSVLKC